MSDINSTSSSLNEIQNLLDEQNEIIEELIEKDDDLTIDIQKMNKIERQLSVEIVEEYNYKLKSLIRKENELINKLLEIKSKRKSIREILEKHIENIVSDFRNL
jgi:uncharacterized coiled-coil DUF342 family protein